MLHELTHFDIANMFWISAWQFGQTVFSLLQNTIICLNSYVRITIRVTMEFSLIISEINFVEVPKMLEIHEIYGPQKWRPTAHALLWT